MYDYNPILARLKAIKKSSNMTNEELSKASSVPLGTINKIFSGDTKEPKLPAFMAIASALGTSVDYLVYGISSVKGKQLTTEEEQLVTDYRDASAEIRSAASRMLHDSAEANRKDGTLSSAG